MQLPWLHVFFILYFIDLFIHKKMFGLSRQRRCLDLPTVYLFSFALWGVYVCRGVGVGVFWESSQWNAMIKLKRPKRKKKENKKER